METPIRRQYLQIRKQYPDAILLFRLGDFYETFDEQAELVARELEITLTSREMGKGQRVPLAGIPYHAASGYIAKLVGRGHKVAVCEQMSDPAESRGLVERAVVRVVTPGTVVDPGMLESKSNNYLVAVVADGDQAGVAYVDVTTGEFGVTQIAASQVSIEVERLQPAELLILAGSEQVAPGPTITPLEERYFRLSRARETLLQHFEVASLEPFGCGHLPLAIRAAGAVLQYVAETQRPALGQLSHPRTYSVDAYMVLDVQARRNLEIFQAARSGNARGSLLGVLDLTRTPMGGRLLRKWLGQPLLEVRRIHARQEVVGELLRGDILRDTVLSKLARVGDLERLINRISLGVASPADVTTLRRSLEGVAEVRQVILPEADAAADRPFQSGLVRDFGVTSLPAARGPLARLSERMDDCTEIVELIRHVMVDDPPPSLADGGVIRPGFSEELDGMRKATSSAKDYIASLERSERSRTGIKSLRVGYNRVFGYFVEVSNANLEMRFNSAVAKEAQLSTGQTETTTCNCATTREHLERCLGYVRKQTLVGAERFFTPELKEYEALVLNGQERIGELESALFRQLCRQVADMAPRVRRTAETIACLDVLAAFAEAAARFGFVRPEVGEGDELFINAGRHPVVERTLPAGEFVPNDVRLSNSQEQILVLTGPNMAGKSTYLRQVALVVVMAQIGSYVPAETAKIGVVDRIFTRIGAQDDLALGQSTFMVEMLETSLALLQSTPRSLLILDEVGRGTSTYDGLAIARAVLEYLHNDRRCGAKTLFATHYHELTKLEELLPRVRNYRMAVLEEGDHIVFLRRVIPGGADRSYGVYVARLAGIPKAVTRRAEEILRELEEGTRSDHQDGRHGLPAPALQLSLFPQADPLIEDLSEIDVDSLTPLEAITKLYELRQRARRSAEMKTKP
ncbi:MAG: DNA mismatch repair protein MutS [Chloroflexota bacterium]|nr:MAG: DNA mismatch repair protein MutS [Chloroflexota bacterium]